jgi:hypothetical protein
MTTTVRLIWQTIEEHSSVQIIASNLGTEFLPKRSIRSVWVAESEATNNTDQPKSHELQSAVATRQQTLPIVPIK